MLKSFCFDDRGVTCPSFTALAVMFCTLNFITLNIDYFYVIGD